MADEVLAVFDHMVADMRRRLEAEIAAKLTPIAPETPGVDLPDEILVTIFDHLHQVDCVRVCQVSRRFNRLGKARLLRHVVVDAPQPLLMSPRYGRTWFNVTHTLVKFPVFLELTLRPGPYLDPMLLKRIVFNRPLFSATFVKMFGEKYPTTEIVVVNNDPTAMVRLVKPIANATCLQTSSGQLRDVHGFSHSLQYLQVNCFGVNIPDLLGTLTKFVHLHTLLLYRVNSLETPVGAGAPVLVLRLLSVDGFINAIPFDSIDWGQLRHLHFDYTGDEYATSLARRLRRLETLLLHDKVVRVFNRDRHVVDEDEVRLLEMRKEFYYGLKCAATLTLVQILFRLKPNSLVLVADLLVKFNDTLEVIEIDHGPGHPRLWTDLTALPARQTRELNIDDYELANNFLQLCFRDGAFPRLQYVLLYATKFFTVTKTFGYYMGSTEIK